MGKFWGCAKPLTFVWAFFLMAGTALTSCSNPLGMANTAKAAYSVKYNGNGNTGGTVPTDGNSYVIGATVTVPTGKPAKAGYSFTSWNTQSAGTGLSYLPGASFSMGEGNVNLYAQWSANPTYAVTYMANATTYTGSVPIDTGGYVSGATVTVADNTGSLAQTGYNFIGWNTAADGTGTSYVAGTTFLMAGADVVLYAKWTNAPTYTLTYSANSATGGSVPVDTNGYLSGASVTIRGNTGSLFKTGYTFAGWNTASDGSGTTYTSGSTLTNLTANKTLYAKWTNLPTYTVTYACTAYDGGSVPTDTNAYISGTSVVVLGNTGNLTRAGYAFTGWNTQSDGTGASYAAGSSLTLAGNTPLYAQWAVLSWGVTYVGNGANGGLVPSDSTLYSQGTSVTVLGAGTMTRSGYSFNGWNSKADGTGTSYPAGASLSMPAGAVILYALWSVNTFTVTYSANSGTGTVTDPTSPYAYGSTVTVMAGTSLAKTGYTFLGWSPSSSATSPTYMPGGTFAITANTVLYAVWTASPTYTLTYSANGATGGTAPTDASAYLTGASVTLAGNTGSLAKTGYTFAGWGLTSTASSSVSSVTISGSNLTVYALWTAQATYHITYNANCTPTSGSVPSDTNNYLSGSSATVLGNTGSLNRSGYTFLGWNTNSSATTALYTGGSTLTVTGNVNLYAIWALVYSVTYNANGGTGTQSDANSYQAGAIVTVLGAGTMACSGYTFNGWTTNSDGTGTAYAAGGTLTMASPGLTLYALWNKQASGTVTITSPTSYTAGVSGGPALYWGQSTTLVATFSGPSTGLSYQWYLNGVSLSNTVNSYTATPATSGTPTWKSGANTLTVLITYSGIVYSGSLTVNVTN